MAQTVDPHVGVDAHRTDELGGLARSFNGMLGRLAHTLDSQRSFIADASHELRTPLTNTSLLFSDRAFDDETTAMLQSAISSELESMQATIEDLIGLAFLDADADAASAWTSQSKRLRTRNVTGHTSTTRSPVGLRAC